MGECLITTRQAPFIGTDGGIKTFELPIRGEEAGVVEGIAEGLGSIAPGDAVAALWVGGVEVEVSAVRVLLDGFVGGCVAEAEAAGR